MTFNRNEAKTGEGGGGVLWESTRKQKIHSNSRSEKNQIPNVLIINSRKEKKKPPRLHIPL